MIEPDKAKLQPKLQNSEGGNDGEARIKVYLRKGDQEHRQDIAVGTLYVQKEMLGEPVPQRLRVTIEGG